LLTQIIKRDELTRLAKDFEVLKEAYIELAIDTLSADERKYYDLVMNGIFGKENINKYLYFQKDIELQGFFPRLHLYGVSRYYSNVRDIKENYEGMKNLGFDVELKTGILQTNSLLDLDLDYLSARCLSPYLYFQFPENTPLFIGSCPNYKDIARLKSSSSKKDYDRFFEVTNNYIKSMLTVATLLGELDFFLNQSEVTLAYLKSNFKELYKLYEDGKEECNNKSGETN
jgi:hypothetical protein